MITAVEIDELYYAEPIKTVTTPAAGLAGAEVATILKNAATKRVKNVHGDTYQYEEAEASVTRYKNALTGEYYRETSEPGEVKINFTIGEYDYAGKYHCSFCAQLLDFDVGEIYLRFTPRCLFRCRFYRC